VLTKSAAILTRSRFEMSMFIGFRSLPQTEQKGSLLFVVGLQFGHDVSFVFLVKIWIFQIFSDVNNKMRVPRKMRTHPPSR